MSTGEASSDKFQLLIRNLRKKQDEKLKIRQIRADLPNRKDGAGNSVPPKADGDKGGE